MIYAIIFARRRYGLFNLWMRHHSKSGESYSLCGLYLLNTLVHLWFFIQNVEALTATYDNIVGDVLLSAGMVAYMGAFILDYRQVRFYVDLLCEVKA